MIFLRSFSHVETSRQTHRSMLCRWKPILLFMLHLYDRPARYFLRLITIQITTRPEHPSTSFIETNFHRFKNRSSLKWYVSWHCHAFFFRTSLLTLCFLYLRMSISVFCALTRSHARTSPNRFCVTKLPITIAVTNSLAIEWWVLHKELTVADNHDFIFIDTLISLVVSNRLNALYFARQVHRSS
jgi:hypothetical protein